MKAELDKTLCDKYPRIFADRHRSPQETAMCWGLSCGDGWYWLIDQLCSYLQWGTDKNEETQVIANQVKEKFGGLRFYVSGANKEQHAVINFAEKLSYSICERCGKMGDDVKTNDKGWIVTVCDDCRGSLGSRRVDE